MKSKLLSFAMIATMSASTLSAQNPQPYTTRYGKPLNDAIYDSVYYRQFNGNPDTTIFYNVNKRTNIVYNLDHLEVSEVEQSGDWGDGSGIWANAYQYTFAYDASKRWIGKTTLSWNGSGWDNHQRSLITYNSHNKEASTTYQSWVEATSSWYNREKDSIVYDAADNIITTISLGWNSLTSNFEPYNKTEYTYSGNLRISAIYYAYNSSLNALAPIVRYSYSYTGTNNDFVLEEYWTGQTWLQTGKFNYDFNDAGQVTKETLKSQQYGIWFKSNVTTNNYNANGILKKRTHKTWFDPNSTSFSGIQQQYYLHHPQPSTGLLADGIKGQPAKNSEDPSIFPNPTTGIFKVVPANNQTVKNIQVFNAVGQKVLEQAAPEVNMSGVEKGVYLIKIDDGVSIHQHKIVIE